MHYGKDFENRVLGQDFLRFSDRNPIAFVILSNGFEESVNTMNAIRHFLRRLIPFAKVDGDGYPLQSTIRISAEALLPPVGGTGQNRIRVGTLGRDH
jgi:hypothetical protein